MRVLHLVTLISPQMEFGGPLRVAANEAAGLQERGHEVALMGGAREFNALPHRFMDLPAFTFRVWPRRARYVIMIAPALWANLPRIASRYDLAHVHLGRDLITLFSAAILRIAGIPYVVQTHGMIEPSNKRHVKALDRTITRFALRGARVALTLTDSETSFVDSLADKRLSVRFGNAVAVESTFHPSVGEPRVLFLARIHPRKRADQFARVAVRIAHVRSDVSFDIAGPDEGAATEVSEIVRNAPKGRLRYLGAIAPAQVNQTMVDATVYVLPAPAEPFGMTILEALSAGRPVVIHETSVLAPLLVANGAAVTFDGSDDSLFEAISSLLDDPARAAEMGRRGHDVATREFGLEQSLHTLEDAYRRVLDG